MYTHIYKTQTLFLKHFGRGRKSIMTYILIYEKPKVNVQQGKYHIYRR